MTSRKSSIAPQRRRATAATANGGEVAIDCNIEQDLLRHFLAVRDSHVPDREGQDHRLHRALGLRQEHGAALPQPHERPRRGFRFEGHVQLPRPGHLRQNVDPVAVRRYIGMVFQQPNPFAMSIYNNVAFGLRLNRFKGNIDERVEQALRRAALWDEVKDKLKTSGLSLSGGQQQRLCIARAIATEPAVLLMDEPCSALDPIATRRIEELMLELKQNYTIAIVTHNMQQAQRVADITAFFSVDISQGRPHRLSRRDGAHRADLREPTRAAHQGIRHRPVQLNAGGVSLVCVPIGLSWRPRVAIATLLLLALSRSARADCRRSCGGAA